MPNSFRLWLGDSGLVDVARFVQDIVPTTRLYLDDSYLQSLDANVVKFAQEKNNAYVL
ncbi:MAG: hypothetical protein ABSA50_12980 [Candidatus Bathyarchaeia archaeon]